MSSFAIYTFIAGSIAFYWLVMGFVTLFTLSENDPNPTVKDLVIYFSLGGAMMPAMLIYKIMTGKNQG